MYSLFLTDKAKADLATLKRNELAAYKKAQKLIVELMEHPTTGHPEQLNGDKAGKWSRHITGKHRLIYEIKEEVVIVNVLAAYGHCGDK